MKPQEVEIAGRTNIDVVLETEMTGLQEVVVTALGVSREKKSLGYATQSVSGESVSTVKTDNFINTLSGKIAGVNIKANGNMGGSTNIVIRGAKSLTGSNQALFVVDGVPIDNANTNNEGQVTGRSGYDFGNAASDINPNDIESIDVLKGAAASALYGSRAANGVIMITTKEGCVFSTGKGSWCYIQFKCYFRNVSIKALSRNIRKAMEEVMVPSIQTDRAIPDWNYYRCEW